MWTCPECGSEFKNTNQWHSCGKFTVEEFLDHFPEDGHPLYRALEAALLGLPGVNVRPVKTRILFRTTAAFASVEKIGASFVDLTFGLRRDADHPRLKRIFREPGDVLGHSVRIKAEEDIESLLPLLDESRLTVGGGP